MSQKRIGFEQTMGYNFSRYLKEIENSLFKSNVNGNEIYYVKKRLANTWIKFDTR